MEAFDRLTRVCEGKPSQTTQVQTGERDDGTPIYGESVTLVSASTADILALVESVPMTQWDERLKALHKGSRNYREPPVMVQITAPDAHHLLAMVKAKGKPDAAPQ